MAKSSLRLIEHREGRTQRGRGSSPAPQNRLAGGAVRSGLVQAAVEAEGLVFVGLAGVGAAGGGRLQVGAQLAHHALLGIGGAVHQAQRGGQVLTLAHGGFHGQLVVGGVDELSDLDLLAVAGVRGEGGGGHGGGAGVPDHVGDGGGGSVVVEDHGADTAVLPGVDIALGGSGSGSGAQHQEAAGQSGRGKSSQFHAFSSLGSSVPASFFYYREGPAAPDIL